MQSLPQALLPFVPWLLAVVAVSLFLRFRRKSTPNRLAELYPVVEPLPGTRLRRDRAIFGRGYLAMARVKIGADAERLHVRVVNSPQGVSSFSAPLADIIATPDRYPWMILAPDTVRLHFARSPETLVMTFPGSFRQLAEASGGRLRLAAAMSAAGTPPAAAR